MNRDLPSEEQLGSQVQREIVLEAWDTLWVVGGGEQDSLLLKPYLIAASDSGVYVFDGGDERLVAFDTNGAMRWRFGGSGAGPDEFLGVRDLKANNESILVLDPRNNRIVRLNHDGHVRSRSPLDGVGHAEQVAWLDTGDFVLLTMDPQNAFVVVDTLGFVRQRFSLPWPGFIELDPIARQGLIASDEQHGWVFGFSLGDGWFSFDGNVPRRTRKYAESTAFPKIEQSRDGGSRMAEYSACSACSISMSGATLYVHFGGYTKDRMAAVDRYNVNTGAYLGSFRLPFSATAISVTGNNFYALVEEPYPMLLALRPRS
jgi:hypothetical protein